MIIHMTGGIDPAKCPKNDSYRCSCKGKLESEYGCCKYGLGSFYRCNKCGKVYNFHEDMGE